MALKNSIKMWLRGLLGTHDGETIDGAAVVVADDVERMFTHSKSWNFAAETNAATNRTLSHLFYTKTAIEVTEVKWVPDVALASSATNFATLTLFSGNGAANAATVVARQRTNVAATAVATPYTLTLTTANVAVAAGRTLGFSVLKAGTGGLVGRGSLVVHYKEA